MFGTSPTPERSARPGSDTGDNTLASATERRRRRRQRHVTATAATTSWTAAAGNDIFFVGSGADIVIERRPGNDTVRGAGVYGVAASRDRSQRHMCRNTAARGRSAAAIEDTLIAHRATLTAAPATTRSRAAPATTRWTAAPAPTPWRAAPATTSTSSTCRPSVIAEAAGDGTDTVRTALASLHAQRRQRREPDAHRHRHLQRHRQLPRQRDHRQRRQRHAQRRHGNDTLNGGAGNDTLYGGAGNDISDVGVATRRSRTSQHAVTLRRARRVGGELQIPPTTSRTSRPAPATTSTGNGARQRVAGRGRQRHARRRHGTDTFIGGAGNDSVDGGTDGDTTRPTAPSRRTRSSASPPTSSSVTGGGVDGHRRRPRQRHWRRRQRHAHRRRWQRHAGRRGRRRHAGRRRRQRHYVVDSAGDTSREPPARAPTRCGPRSPPTRWAPTSRTSTSPASGDIHGTGNTLDNDDHRQRSATTRWTAAPATTP